MASTKFDPKKHHRRSIRLPGYDYTRPGGYYITIVTYNRECLFGEIERGEMILNQAGIIVQKTWHDLPKHYLNVALGVFVIMPNHVHGIIILNDMDILNPTVGAGLRPAPTSRPAPTQPIKQHGIPEIVRAFKLFSSRRINEALNSSGAPIWQRNYYEHIVRDMDDANRIHGYIDSNPLKWDEDEENPSNVKFAI